MKVIKPTLITPAMVVSNDAPADVAPEWVSGAIYNPNTSVATDQASHAPLVKKPTFSDASVGSWSSYVTASSSSSGEMRVKDRDTLEGGNTFAVAAGETFYVAFDVDSTGTTFGGAVGLAFVNAAGQTFTWLGAGYAPGQAWARVYGSIAAPAGAVQAIPWVQINTLPWVDAARPYTSIDSIYIARGQEGSGSTNLVVKPTFASATLGGWAGNAGTANTTAVTNTRGGAGQIAVTYRDTLEVGNDFTVYPDETLYIAYDASTISSAYSGMFGVMIKDDAGVVIGWLGVPCAPGAAWAHKSGSIKIPSGAATATPWLQINGPHSTSIGPIAYTNLYLCRHAKGTLGPYVRRSRVRKVFERLTTGTSTAAPEDDAVNWMPVAPINEWAMFDREISTHTQRPSSLTVTVKPGNVNSLSLFGLTGSEVRVTVRNGSGGPIVYGNSTLTGPKIIPLDGTLITDWYQYYYEPSLSLMGITLTDLPPYLNAHISVTVIGAGNVAVGLLDVGSFYDLGGAEYSPSLTIVDYSKKVTDEFGVTTFTKRSFAKRLHARAMFDNVQLGKVAGVLASLRATPCAWSLTDETGFETLNLFGWYEDIDIDVAYLKQSYCTINVQGLSE